MSFETVASTVVVLAILVCLIAFLAFLKKKGLNVSDSMVAGITSSHVNGGFNRDVFNDSNAQVSAAGEIEA